MRLIDADALNGYKFGLISPYAQNLFHKTINDAPTIMPERKTGRWIPVSKRLPEDHENVLIYLSSNQITIGLYNSHRLPFTDKPIGWGADAPHGWSSDEVVAWMPLPETYKIEEQKCGTDTSTG